MTDLKNKRGITIPSIGLGTYPLQGDQVSNAVVDALKAGYRLIDTSDDYHNEIGIGRGIALAIEQKIVQREDVFLLTKVSDNNTYKDDPLAGQYFCQNSSFMRKHTVEEVVREKVSISLRDLQTDYLDAVLIHVPYVGYFKDIWNTLCDLKDEGVIRYIGVSNCRPKHFEMLEDSKYQPQIHQFYMSPIGAKTDVVSYCKNKGIQLMTYSPLTDLRDGKVDMSIYEPMMKKYQKSAAQIILRWNIQCGSIPLAKSSKIKRLQENFDVLSFELSEEDMNILNSLNVNYQYIAESKMSPGLWI